MNENIINFSFPALLSKSTKKAPKGRIPITIIPNHPSPDRVNDTISSKAFDEECKKSYLKDGIIDYDHLSVRGETALEKAQAVIGEPEDLLVKDGIPYCDAFLFEENPFVRDSIAPALKSDSKVFGASVGGRVLKSVLKDPINKSNGKNIFKIRLNHIAVCPLNKAVHQGTTIYLRKSEQDTDIKSLNLNSINDLFKSFESEDEDYFEKALMAGAATDISGVSGGQALQTQSLEGSVKKLIYGKSKLKIVLPFVLEKVKEGKLSDKKSYYKYLTGKGLTKNETNKIINLIASNSYKIVKAFYLK